MQRIQFLLALAVLIAFVYAGSCPIAYEKKTIISLEDAYDCMKSISPFFAMQLQSTTETLKTALNFYPFLDHLKNPPAPYDDVAVNLIEDLSDLVSNSYTNDYDAQMDVFKTILGARDLHTIYLPPVYTRIWTFMLPVSIYAKPGTGSNTTFPDLYLDNVGSNIDVSWTKAEYNSKFSDNALPTSLPRTKKITKINNMDAWTYLQMWADKHVPMRTAAQRLTAAVSSYFNAAGLIFTLDDTTIANESVVTFEFEDASTLSVNRFAMSMLDFAGSSDLKDLSVQAKTVADAFTVSPGLGGIVSVAKAPVSRILENIRQGKHTSVDDLFESTLLKWDAMYHSTTNQELKGHLVRQQISGKHLIRRGYKPERPEKEMKSEKIGKFNVKSLATTSNVVTLVDGDDVALFKVDDGTDVTFILKVGTFMPESASAGSDWVKDLKKSLNAIIDEGAGSEDGTTKLCIDLRENGGGMDILFMAVISSLFGKKDIWPNLGIRYGLLNNAYTSQVLLMDDQLDSTGLSEYTYKPKRLSKMEGISDNSIDFFGPSWSSTICQLPPPKPEWFFFLLLGTALPYITEVCDMVNSYPKSGYRAHYDNTVVLLQSGSSASSSAFMSHFLQDYGLAHIAISGGNPGNGADHMGNYQLGLVPGANTQSFDTISTKMNDDLVSLPNGAGFVMSLLGVFTINPALYADETKDVLREFHEYEHDLVIPTFDSASDGLNEYIGAAYYLSDKNLEAIHDALNASGMWTKCYEGAQNRSVCKEYNEDHIVKSVKCKADGTWPLAAANTCTFATCDYSYKYNDSDGSCSKISIYRMSLYGALFQVVGVFLLICLCCCSPCIICCCICCCKARKRRKEVRRESSSGSTFSGSSRTVGTDGYHSMVNSNVTSLPTTTTTTLSFTAPQQSDSANVPGSTNQQQLYSSMFGPSTTTSTLGAPTSSIDAPANLS